jgi:putative addiction module component (TIGR02574 family)
MSKPAVDIGTLTREERLDLIADLWDSLGGSVDVPLTTEDEAELDRRLDGLDREGPVGIAPTDLRKGLRRPS